MSGRKPDYTSYAMNRLDRLNRREGEVPKPVRLKVIVRVIRQLHTELMDAKNIGKAIAAKDPRTQKAYVDTLEHLKMSQVHLEEIVNTLHTELLEREGKAKDESRSDLLLKLWNSGKSGEEVAAIMGIKPVSVYSWLTRLRGRGRDVRSPMRDSEKVEATQSK